MIKIKISNAIHRYEKKCQLKNWQLLTDFEQVRPETHTNGECLKNEFPEVPLSVTFEEILSAILSATHKTIRGRKREKL